MCTAVEVCDTEVLTSMEEVCRSLAQTNVSPQHVALDWYIAPTHQASKGNTSIVEHVETHTSTNGAVWLCESVLEIFTDEHMCQSTSIEIYASKFAAMDGMSIENLIMSIWLMPLCYMMCGKRV